MSNQPYHVLITRLSAIGDCVLTLPLATAIKQAMPAAKVSWCVSCAGRSLIEICPDVDNVINVSKRWIKEPSSWRQMRNLFRENVIDCVIDPQSLTKSALLGRLSKAPTRIGFTKPQGRELAPWFNTLNVEYQDGHLADNQLRLLEPIGIKPEKAQFRLNIPIETIQWASSTLNELVDHPSPVVINPGAGWDSRLWPTDRFGEIAIWLKQEFQIPTVIVWAGKEERIFADEIQLASGGIAAIAPDTNLIQLAALLGSANTFLSSDTGPMHVAAAMGTRCLSLHGPTNPEISGPYGDQHLSIRKIAFDGTSRERRKADNWSMKEITVSDVKEKLAEMLARPIGLRFAA